MSIVLYSHRTGQKETGECVRSGMRGVGSKTFIMEVRVWGISANSSASIFECVYVGVEEKVRLAEESA